MNDFFTELDSDLLDVKNPEIHPEIRKVSMQKPIENIRNDHRIPVSSASSVHKKPDPKERTITKKPANDSATNHITEMRSQMMSA